MSAMILSRRSVLSSAGWLGAGALTFGARPAFAAAATEAEWPRLAAWLDGYVSARKVAGAVAAMGCGAPSSFCVVPLPGRVV